jgi:hypothetical protein
MVVVMGASLLAGRLWRMRRGGVEGAHRHGLFGKPHSHLPEDRHVHDHGSEGEHQHHDHEAASRVTWRSLLTLGVAGGMIPCPSAIVVMLTAISLGQVAFGMLLIVAFSLGLAGVLTAIGIALTVGKRVSSRAGAARLLARPALLGGATSVPSNGCRPGDHLPGGISRALGVRSPAALIERDVHEVALLLWEARGGIGHRTNFTCFQRAVRLLVELAHQTWAGC